MAAAAYFSDITWDDVEARAGHGFGAFDSPCPVCSPDRKPANRRLKVLRIWREADDFARYNCCHCDLKGVVFRDQIRSQPMGAISRALFGGSAAEEVSRIERLAETERESREKAAFAEFTYFSADPIEDSLAEAYLAGRGVIAGADLRFTRIGPFSYTSDRTGPAMIAAVRNPAGAVVAAQLTHLHPDGTPLLRPDGKKLRTSFGPVGEGAVRLAEMGADGVLAIAEGTEKALAFTALYGAPCWSTLGKGGIRRFQAPAGLRRLVVAADNDPDGLDAAHQLARRIAGALEVHIAAPVKAGDWNDVLLEKAA